MRRVLIVVNVGWFFLSHRLPVAMAAQQCGYEVHVATALDPVLDMHTPAALTAYGITLHKLEFSRRGAHPAELWRNLQDLMRIYKRLRPDLVHLVALKPLLLGGLAARFSGVRNVVLAVPGRGSVFSARGFWSAVRRWLALGLYHLAYRRGRSRVIIQNVEDRDYFLGRRVFAAQDVRLIRGSGVDLKHFRVTAEAAGQPVVVFASRMLKEKGVEDFVAAASLLRERGVWARFVLVGEPDHGNPHSHTRQELERWAAAGIVEWWGFRSGMSEVFAVSHIVCLPTYYGEGVPKVLIEAAACARPIVTTDIPGCRDIVRDGYNGTLVKPRDVVALSRALQRLLESAELRRHMGQCGRQLVEREFSLDIVVRQTLDIYREFAS